MKAHRVKGCHIKTSVRQCYNHVAYWGGCSAMSWGCFDRAKKYLKNKKLPDTTKEGGK